LATIAHPTASEFGKPRDASSVRAALERAVDDAPSHVRPPRGRLRRLFARDRSARALVERYRLWPAIEHAWARVTREYGPVRPEISAEDGWGDPYVRVEFIGHGVPETDDVFEFDSLVGQELWDIVGKRGRHRLSVFIRPEYGGSGAA